MNNTENNNESVNEERLKNSLKNYFKYVFASNAFPSVSDVYSGSLLLLEEIKGLKQNIKSQDKKYKNFLVEALQNNEEILNKANGNLSDLISKNKEIYTKFIEQLKFNRKKVHFINLDKEGKDYWEKLFDKFFSLPKFSGCFIFYYLIDEEETGIWKENAEYNRKSFGHSRFLRDYLKARGLSIEIPIYIECKDCVLENTKFEIENFIQKERGQINPKDEFDGLYKCFNESVIELFPNIPFDQIFKEKKDIIHFYKFDKNAHEDKNGLFTTDFYKSYIGELKNPKNSHENLRELDQLYKSIFTNEDKKELINKSNLENIGKFVFLSNFRKAIGSFFNAMICYKKYEQDIIFLFIDDRPELLIDKIKIIKLWFNKARIFFADCSAYNIKDYCEQLKNLSESVHLRVTEYGDNEEKNYRDTTIYSEVELYDKDKECVIKEGEQLFIFIDLDFNGIVNGLKFLYGLNNYIAHNRNILKEVYPIVFSRYEDPYLIRKAVNAGAIYYINKSRFYTLIHKLFELEKRETDELQTNDFTSWNTLNKIEPSLRIKLKSDKLRITGNEVELECKNDKKEYDRKIRHSEEYKWIHGLPKADLHIHIGTTISSEILPKTAIMVIYDLYCNSKIKDETIQDIIEFLLPIAFDPYISEGGVKQAIKNNKEIYKILKSYKNTLRKDGKGKNDKSIFKIIDNDYKLIANKLLPEVVLLDPTDTTLERLVEPQKLNGKYFQLKHKLRQNKEANYDFVMLFFIYLIAHRQKLLEKGVLGEIDTYITKEVVNIDSSLKNTENKDAKKEETANKKIERKLRCDSISNFSNDIINKYVEKQIIEELRESIGADILKFLQSARSKQRCLGEEGSLFNYLRGCEYGGAPHLQSKLSIYYVCKSIIYDYAIPDNIRYLGLRCAADGYSKLGLLSQEEALEALLRGFNFYSKEALEEKQKKVHVDIILTAKRHKSSKEFENNVRLALKYRYGLEIMPAKEQKIDSYFQSQSKVVSFDLAGNEKGNRVSKFTDLFYPLLKESFPITVHAGEEDDHESIWEAIFLINSHRIGHALTLGQDEKLLNMVRDRHIAIELCPLSNYLTRKEKYEVNKDAFKKIDEEIKDNYEELNKMKIYPLTFYFNENINVTINSDNPSVSDSTLTEEYLFASKMSGGLSRWNILKIVKNGFKNISTDKFEKEKLMREIEDEIFQYVTK